MKIKKILAMYIILGFNSFVRFHFKLIVDREILNQYKNRWIQNLFGINKKIKVRWKNFRMFYIDSDNHKLILRRKSSDILVYNQVFLCNEYEQPLNLIKKEIAIQ